VHHHLSDVVSGGAQLRVPQVRKRKRIRGIVVTDAPTGRDKDPLQGGKGKVEGK